MKKITLFSLFMIVSCMLSGHSQTVYYNQDFEGSNITNFRNWDGNNFVENTLREGESTCGIGSKADATIHSSDNISADPSGNSTEFFAINPEVCGGFTDGLAASETFDLSGATTQLYLSFKYLASTTSPFGGEPSARISITDGTDAFGGATTMDELSARNSWTSYEIQLPETANVADAYIVVSMFGGNLVAFDDIKVSSEPILSVSTFKNSEFVVHVDYELKRMIVHNDGSKAIDNINVYDLSGRLMAKTQHSNFIDFSHLRSGVYIAEIQDGASKMTRKIVLE